MKKVGILKYISLIQSEKSQKWSDFKSVDSFEISVENPVQQHLSHADPTTIKNMGTSNYIRMPQMRRAKNGLISNPITDLKSAS